MINRTNFDKLDRLRDEVLVSIKNIDFGVEDTLEIQVEFVGFIHRLIERDFREPVVIVPPIAN